VEGRGGTGGGEELGMWSLVWGVSSLWSAVRRGVGLDRSFGKGDVSINVYMLVLLLRCP